MTTTSEEPAAAASSRPIVEVRSISKRFGGVRALESVDLAFRPGEVHCLAGENGCGKSTLMKIISGVHRPTAGEVVIDGESHTSLTPRQASALGIQVIYQDLSLVPNLSAAENIAMPAYLSGGSPLVSRSRMRRLAAAALAQLGVEIDVRTLVEDLTVAERQLCAIARALAQNARFVAMDEPTTALTWREVEVLFEAVRKLRDRGVAIVFVSHKMQEVFSLADRVSVMRNGRIVDSTVPAKLTHASLTVKMTGRTEALEERAAPVRSDRPPALDVRSLTLVPLFADISFTVGAGEIVGLSGLLGSGRTEIAEAIAGVRPAHSGEILVDGEPVRVRSVPSAVAAGIGNVPEDRLTQGLFLDQPIEDNIAAAHLRRFTRRGGWLDRSLMRATASAIAKDLRIKAHSLTDPVRTLSGGNAQRVLLAKGLLAEPRVLVLNGPTVGVDVGSKYDILSVLHQQSLKGMGIVVISDDVPELVQTCHRVLVVRSGRLVAELLREDLTEDSLVKALA